MSKPGFSASNKDSTDVAKFRSDYCSYYAMSRLPAVLKDCYFKLMEQYKDEWKDVNDKNRNEKASHAFKAVMTILRKESIQSGTRGRFWPSFTSKMLATIDDNLPVWDENTISFFEINLGPYNRASGDKRLEEAASVYKKLLGKTKDYLVKDEAETVIEEFSHILPGYKDKISDAKKLDVIVWAYGARASLMHE